MAYVPPHRARLEALEANGNGQHMNAPRAAPTQNPGGYSSNGPLTGSLGNNHGPSSDDQKPKIANREGDLAAQFALRQQAFAGMKMYVKEGKNPKKNDKKDRRQAPPAPPAPVQQMVEPPVMKAPEPVVPVEGPMSKHNKNQKKHATGDLRPIVTSSLKGPQDIVRALKTNLVGLEGMKTKSIAMDNLKAICRAFPDDKYIVPYTVAGLPVVLSALGGSRATSEHNMDVARTIIKNSSPNSVKAILDVLFTGLQDYKWQIKMGCLTLVGVLASHGPLYMGRCLPEVILKLSDCLQDTKAEVRNAAMDTFNTVCKSVVTNPDIQPIMQILIKAYANPVTDTQIALDKLLETTFVSTVDAATLALLCPVLRRGMLERQPEPKRKSACIINNMCKLVVDPRAAAEFFPILEPVLTAGAEEVVFEVVKKNCEQAIRTLTQVTGDAHTNLALEVSKEELLQVLMQSINDTVTEETRGTYADVFEFVTGLCSQLLMYGTTDLHEWKTCIVPYLSVCMPKAEAMEVCNRYKEHCSQWLVKMDRQTHAAEEDICNIDFSLAYGGKILLHNARLWLTRGHRYGLVGQNGVGKTTLMRSIANRQVESLPKSLNTVFVESNIDANCFETPVIDFVRSVANVQNNSSCAVVDMLNAVGFEESMRSSPISELSGGWRMRLALACAMLQNPDLLLMDEPTNHLDENAVLWLTEYLQNLTHVTCIIVSHSSSFVNDVCTDIIHFVDLQLQRFTGNLTAFVEKYPDTKFHFNLLASQLLYKFPAPGKLEGVKSRSKKILKLENCTFTYPGAAKPALSNVTVGITLGSRVAVTGPNGAGKSTLIKLMVGEEEADKGEYYKHHNLRIAYVAQHSFHHLEEHLESSPVSYFQWRFANGQDKEIFMKKSMQLTEAEQENVGKELGQVEKIVGRRTRHKELEYEVQWVGRPEKDNRYLTRAQLEKMGLQKLVAQADEKIALEATGNDLRALTTEEVQMHLNDFGLPQEFGTYGKISGLSGGQKVKLVLASAVWNCPHILILDEPTNFLDKESLGAFASALQGFGGGVIMISHDKEFYSLVCPEVWQVMKGRVFVEGESGNEDCPLAMAKKKEEVVLDLKDVAGANVNAAKANAVPTDFWGRPLSKKELRKRKG
jgi:elongation factor 3